MSHFPGRDTLIVVLKRQLKKRIKEKDQKSFLVMTVVTVVATLKIFGHSFDQPFRLLPSNVASKP